MGIVEVNRIPSCLDLASSKRGRILAAFTAASSSLQTHVACRQEKRVIIIIIIESLCSRCLNVLMGSYFGRWSSTGTCCS